MTVIFSLAPSIGLSAGVSAIPLIFCHRRSIALRENEFRLSPHAFAFQTKIPIAPGGFARYELFVIMGCLAMLAGLVLPALAGRTTPRSERVVCVNNLRQIGLGYANVGGGQRECIC